GDRVLRISQGEIRRGRPRAPRQLSPRGDCAAGGRVSAPQPPLLEARHVAVHLGGTKRFLRKRVPPVRAVADVSLKLYAGETLGLVGESGCGKTTLGRTLLGIQRETSGEILLDGRVVSGVPPEE